jgi:serine O-acetyltransferase
MIKMIRKFIYFFGQLLFLPHVILFLFSSERESIIEDIYARKSKKQGILNHCYYLSLELLQSTYFRTLFYFRTNSITSKVLRVFYPKNNSFTIDITTKIGKGLQLAHPYSTILNAESIGNNVYVNHLVTLGEKNKKRPIIGNNVELHAGCIIIGGITIGDNAIIGAGSVVVKDVPTNSIAVGNPARIIEKNNE